MKKILCTLLVLIASAMHAFATDEITTATILSIPQGGTGRLEISLSNPDGSYGGFQFDLKLPAGVSVTQVQKAARLTAIADYTLEQNLSDAEHNIYTVLGYNSKRQSIAGTSGAIVYVTLSADVGMTVGDAFTAQMNNVTLSTVDLDQIDVASSTFTITVKAKEYTILDEASTTAPVASEGEVDVKVLRTIKADEWSTLVLPFDMTEEQLKAALGDDVQLAEFINYEAEYTGDDVTGLAVNFAATDLTEGFYGNYPYLVKTSKEITEFIVKATVDPDEDGAVAEYDNGRTGRNRKVYGSLIGTYHAGDAIPADGLFLNGNKFWYSSGKTKIKAFRAYFMLVDVLSSSGGEAKIRITVDEKPTKIEGIGEPNVIQGAVYNVNGQLVGHDIDLNSQPKGIYFVDGKKVANY